jgi:hypothetical protein
MGCGLQELATCFFYGGNYAIGYRVSDLLVDAVSSPCLDKTSKPHASPVGSSFSLPHQHVHSQRFDYKFVSFFVIITQQRRQSHFPCFRLQISAPMSGLSQNAAIPLLG